MKHFFLSLLLVAGMMGARAQSMTEWQDQHINSVNRLPMRTSFFAFEDARAARDDKAQSNRYLVF